MWLMRGAHRDTKIGTDINTTRQGGKPLISLNGVCPWLINGLSRYLSSKIAGIITPKGRAGRHRLFELYLLGYRLELFLAKNKTNLINKNSFNKTSLIRRIDLDLKTHPEFSFVSDGTLGSKYSMQSALPEQKDFVGINMDRIRKYRVGEY